MLRVWIIGLLAIQNAFAIKQVLTSRAISYTLCSQCSKCTGFFLNKKTILTAAHCKEKILTVSPYLDGFRIYLKKSRRIWNYSLHSSPDYERKNRANDVMIIKLQEDTIKLSGTFPSPPLIADDNLEGEFWSRGFNRVLSFKLHKRELKQRLHFIHIGEAATCNGDSGAVTYIRHPSGVVRLVAVISGIKRLEGRHFLCSVKNNSVHTWLYPHLEWIQSFIQTKQSSN